MTRKDADTGGPMKSPAEVQRLLCELDRHVNARWSELFAKTAPEARHPYRTDEASDAIHALRAEVKCAWSFLDRYDGALTMGALMWQVENHFLSEAAPAARELVLWFETIAALHATHEVAAHHVVYRLRGSTVLPSPTTALAALDDAEWFVRHYIPPRYAHTAILRPKLGARDTSGRPRVTRPYARPSRMDLAVIPVVIADIETRPRVFGREVPTLSPSQYKYVAALCRAWPNRVSCRELFDQGVDSPHKTAGTLIKSSQWWREVLDTPGGRRGRGHGLRTDFR